MNDNGNRSLAQVGFVDVAEYAVVLAVTLVSMVGLLRFLGLVG